MKLPNFQVGYKQLNVWKFTIYSDLELYFQATNVEKFHFFSVTFHSHIPIDLQMNICAQLQLEMFCCIITCKQPTVCHFDIWISDLTSKNQILIINSICPSKLIFILHFTHKPSVQSSFTVLSYLSHTT